MKNIVIQQVKSNAETWILSISAHNQMNGCVCLSLSWFCLFFFRFKAISMVLIFPLHNGDLLSLYCSWLSSLLPSCSSRYWPLDYLNMRGYTLYSVTFNFYYANTTILSTYRGIISHKTHPAFFFQNTVPEIGNIKKTKHVYDTGLYNLLERLRKYIIEMPLQAFPWPQKIVHFDVIALFWPPDLQRWPCFYWQGIQWPWLRKSEDKPCPSPYPSSLQP